MVHSHARLVGPAVREGREGGREEEEEEEGVVPRFRLEAIRPVAKERGGSRCPTLPEEGRRSPPPLVPLPPHPPPLPPPSTLHPPPSTLHPPPSLSLTSGVGEQGAQQRHQSREVGLQGRHVSVTEQLQSVQRLLLNPGGLVGAEQGLEDGHAACEGF
jgi:hypothetical protein